MANCMLCRTVCCNCVCVYMYIFVNEELRIISSQTFWYFLRCFFKIIPYRVDPECDAFLVS